MADPAKDIDQRASTDRTAVQTVLEAIKKCLRCIEPAFTETDCSTQSCTSSTHYDRIVTVIDDRVGLA